MSFLASVSGGESPSFFELTAVSELQNSLRPALQFAAAVLASRYPRLLRAHLHSDEVFFGLLALLELAHLRRGDASFAESFYGLRRVRGAEAALALAAKTSAGRQRWQAQSALRPRDRWASLLCLVVVPYLRVKLEALYELLSGGAAAGLLHRPPPGGGGGGGGRATALFVRWFGWCHAAVGGTQLAYQLRYLVGAGPYWAPLMHLVGLQFARQDATAPPASSPLPASLGARALTMARKGAYAGFLLAVFAFKFLEWWHRTEASLPSRRRAVPPAPPLAVPHAQGVALPPDTRDCPLCRRPRVNEAALPSGYMFCYACAFNFVTAQRRCPVTRQPCQPHSVRRVFR